MEVALSSKNTTTPDTRVKRLRAAKKSWQESEAERMDPRFIQRLPNEDDPSRTKCRKLP